MFNAKKAIEKLYHTVNKEVYSGVIRSGEHPISFDEVREILEAGRDDIDSIVSTDKIPKEFINFIYGTNNSIHNLVHDVQELQDYSSDLKKTLNSLADRVEKLEHPMKEYKPEMISIRRDVAEKWVNRPQCLTSDFELMNDIKSALKK